MFLNYRGPFAIDPGAKLKTKRSFHELCTGEFSKKESNYNQLRHP
jgi:hypothetical protein